VALDPDLLEKARLADAALERAEREALLSRADYHTAIRRLHLAGGSLREIAQALDLSHQRVQQIVSGAGGTWWRRAWRTRTARPDAVCTWCGRPPREVARLIAGPRVYICDGCIAAAERLASSGTAGPGPFLRIRTTGAARRCAFCGRRARPERALITAPAGHICTDCLHTCREILG
jgi:ClpX C4-type zinc finger